MLDPQAFIRKYIGVPYKKLDCWGLAQTFYDEVMGYKLPTYYTVRPYEDEEINNEIYKYIPQFQIIERPTTGDLILLRVTSLPCHIGIYLNEEIFLHTTKTTGAIVDKLDRWNKRIEGFYKVK